MKRTRHTPERIVTKLREADAMLAAGKTVAQVVQALGVERADVLALAEPVRRDEGRGGAAAEGTGDRERAGRVARTSARATGGRSDYCVTCAHGSPARSPPPYTNRARRLVPCCQPRLPDSARPRGLWLEFPFSLCPAITSQ
jgi:hypothetical protein